MSAGPFRAGELRVHEVIGAERLSRPFRYRVTVTSDVEEQELLRAVLGGPGCLTIQRPTGPRYVHGVVVSCTARERVARGDAARFVLELAPRMALLRDRRTSRIFQDVRVDQVIDRVLEAAAIERRWALLGRYTERGYVVQYRETDADFLARQLSESGIFYYFEHPEVPLAEDGATPREVVVFADHATAYRELEHLPELHLRDAEGMAPIGEHIREFERVESLKPRVATVLNADFTQSHRVMVATYAEKNAWDDVSLHDDEHHTQYLDLDVTLGTARRLLEQHRRRAVVARGAGDCRGITPGRRFTLVDPARPSLAREWVAVRVRHHLRRSADRSEAAASGGGRVANTVFECVPASVAYRARRRPHRLQQVIEPAVVVGPPGEDIYTDELGRVRVQFHWDREGTRDEHSTCWIRVLQPWAGQGWGTQFVPRVGTEVMVGFQGGDTDRPLILGGVYNVEATTPFALPEQKTRTGIRTRTSPGGDGFNELSFEDLRGHEQIHLNAQRDLDVRVQRRHTVEVGGQEQVRVTGNRVMDVGGDQHTTVKGDLTTRALADQVTEVRGSRADTVRGEELRIVRGSATTRVGVDALLQTGRDCRVIVGHHGTDQVADLRAWGDVRVDAEGVLELIARGGVRIRCGDSTLSMTDDHIEIKSRSVSLTGTDELTVQGNGPTLHLTDRAELSADDLRLFASGATLRLDAEAKLLSSAIKLQSGSERPPGDSADATSQTRPLVVRAMDAAHRALANRKYELRVQGKTLQGTTDGDGVATVDVPRDARLARFTVWPDDPPRERSLSWDVRIAPQADAGSVAGAQQRLANLGLYGGLAHGEIDHATREAIRRFQRLHELAETGELDDDTRGKIADVPDRTPRG